jgi:hypothetical protein
MIESAGMGGTKAASDLSVQTVGDVIPIPSPKRRLGIWLPKQPNALKLASVSSRLHGLTTAETVMAKPVTQITLGIDVAKDHLVWHCWHTGQCEVLDNEPAA